MITIWIIGFLITTGIYQSDKDYKSFHALMLVALWPLALGRIIADVINRNRRES
jgi:hypothetical protein